MQVTIYVAEVRNYGPGDRIGSAIEPWKTLYSFQPIPKREWTRDFKCGSRIETRTYRQTGGDEFGISVTTVGGEWGLWGDKYVKLPRTNYLRAEDLLKRAQGQSRRQADRLKAGLPAEALDCFLTTVRRPRPIEVPAPHFALPTGPAIQVALF